MFAQRLKQLRAENQMTQVQLAEKLGVSKGTVAMWETDKRSPSFEMLAEMTNLFDRRIDYILGYSDDPSSPKPTDEEMNQMELWAAEECFHETIMAYLRLDEYGKNAVEALINNELQRCRDQETTFPEENFRLSIQVLKG
jgi:transcriptional regulator with XRE-family HTH domain